MKLSAEQESMLKGEDGEAVSLALKTLIDYGEAFGASRLVPIKSAHLAGSFGVAFYKAYYSILERLVLEGARVKTLTTVNPRPGRDFSFLNRFVFGAEKKLEGMLSTLGVFPNYSCVCYEKVNAPERGEVVAWAESSAVQYGNSVLGARTNRNSVLIDLCSAVTGVTPEFGYLLDENRRGQVMVKLEVERMDAAGLGFILGRKMVDRVPVIEHYDFSKIELKNMGGAMAASGGVAMFHVEGLTPEAPDLEAAFQGKPFETVRVTQKELDDLRTKSSNPSAVVFGCPQMTFEEALEVGEHFCGKKASLPVYFCMVPAEKEKFEQTELGEKVKRAGVRLVDFCPLAAFTVRREGKKILSNSGKLYYYLAGAEYGLVEDCLRASGVSR